MAFQPKAGAISWAAYNQLWIHPQSHIGAAAMLLLDKKTTTWSTSSWEICSCLWLSAANIRASDFVTFTNTLLSLNSAIQTIVSSIIAKRGWFWLKELGVIACRHFVLQSWQLPSALISSILLNCWAVNSALSTSSFRCRFESPAPIFRITCRFWQRLNPQTQNKTKYQSAQQEC